MSISFSQLRSRTPDSASRTAERIDPYWGGLWVPRSSAVWIDRRSAALQHRAGAARVPQQFRVDPAYAESMLHRDWDSKLAIVSVLDAFRTATAQQLAAFTGDDKVSAPQSRMLHHLFALDLVDYARLASVFKQSRTARGAEMWRPSASGAKRRARLVRDRLTYAEWALATGGHGWVSGRQSSRHDMLTTELALRAAEFVPAIRGVLGEKFTLAEELLFTSWGRPWPLGERYRMIADGLLLRQDGLRIIVEMTASTFGLRQKALRYARMMSLGGTDTQGAVVLFVVAKRPDMETVAGDSFGDVMGEVARACEAHPGPPGRRTAERVFVTTWADWFPSLGVIDERFLQLTARRSVRGAAETEEVPLADVEVALPPRAAETVQTAAGLLQSPHWFRQRYRGVGLTDLLTQRVFAGSTPQVESVDRSGSPVPEPRMPVRLRG